jgi:exodeoxyribonuclease VII large subunit
MSLSDSSRPKPSGYFGGEQAESTPMSQPSFDFAAPVAPAVPVDTGEADTTYSVGELAEAINGTLRRRFGDGVWVRGEIQGWNERGPHAYFRLVDNGPDGKAVLNVQLFAPARSRLRPVLEQHGLRLSDGLKVRVFGRLDLYAPSGQLGLKMTDVDPRFTLGDMAIQRDELIRRLVASGLYDANRRRPLAVAPLRVGVVASVDSAAWADFVHELERSGLAFHVRVADVRVQGPTAVPMITRALRLLGSAGDLDAVALIRGGGAKTELATFDHESIATAIAAVMLPVFTGLGHEIDRSIADEVAHSAFKTPTACAAGLVERVQSFLSGVEQSWVGVARRAEQLLTRADHELATAGGSIGHRTESALDRCRTRLAGAVSSIARLPARLDTEQRHLLGLDAQVRLADPVLTMARGWSITRTADGRTVRDAAHLAAGDLIVTTFARGSATSTVRDVQPEPTQPEPTQPEPTQPEPTQPEPTQPEPTQGAFP